MKKYFLYALILFSCIGLIGCGKYGEKDIIKDLNRDKKNRDIGKYTPVEFYIEWDRLRMILNPKAKLSQAQIVLGKKIPSNWMLN